MSIHMLLLHRAMRLFSDYLMLPLFRLLGETRDSVAGGRLCVLHTVGRKNGRPREIPLNYAPTTQGLAVLAGFGGSTGWVHNLVEKVSGELVCFHLRNASISMDTLG